MMVSLDMETKKLSSLGVTAKDISKEIEFRNLSADERRGAIITGPLSDYSTDQLYSIRSFMEQIESEIGMDRYLSMRKEEIKVLVDSYSKFQARLSDPKNLVGDTIELVDALSKVLKEYVYAKASMKQLPELSNELLDLYKDYIELYTMAETEATRPDKADKAKREADFDEKLKSMSPEEREAHLAELMLEDPLNDDLGLSPF